MQKEKRITWLQANRIEGEPKTRKTNFEISTRESITWIGTLQNNVQSQMAKTRTHIESNRGNKT
jgi:hypothetical protein